MFWTFEHRFPGMYILTLYVRVYKKSSFDHILSMKVISLVPCGFKVILDGLQAPLILILDASQFTLLETQLGPVQVWVDTSGVNAVWPETVWVPGVARSERAVCSA